MNIIDKYGRRMVRVIILLTALIILAQLSLHKKIVKTDLEVEIPVFTVSQPSIQSENSFDPEKDLRNQIQQLITNVSEELDMDRRQILVLFELADSKPVYESRMPDILKEETSKDEAPPLTIEGAEETELLLSEIVRSENTLFRRPSERYLPDRLYSIALRIKEIMEERHEINADSSNVYYNSLNDNIQNTIDFDEAILTYIGESEEHIDNFKDVYEKILTDKDANENVIEIVDEKPVVRNKFKNILREANMTKYSSLRALAVLFSHDQTLFKNDNIDKLTDAYVYPYEIGLTTRENMMTAAMSLVGDVRYVWGGGHSGAAYIKGINPVWKQFNKLYPNEPFSSGVSKNNPDHNEGFGTCIKPSGSWCPIHGYQSASFHGETIYSIDQYIDLRSELFDKIDLTDDKYRDMLSTVNYKNGVNAHIMDGLDCSGYVSWLYNQIQNDYNVNTAARYFTTQACFKPLSMGSDLLPGDIFAWQKHIVVIVGRVREDSQAYVTLEETPNVLRFGVAYYSEASSEDIAYGKQIAAEANSLIGGLNSEYEKPHVYCINTVGLSPSNNMIIPTSFVKESNNGQGSSAAYDTLIDGVPYQIVKVYMPKGYPGEPQELGAPDEGDYESLDVEEEEDGFLGTYYIRLEDESEAGHSADEKIDGYLVRHIFMPRDYDGPLEDLGVPDDSIVEKKDVIEEDEGFYATYYTDPKKSSKDKKKHKDDEDDDDDDDDDDEDEDEEEEDEIVEYDADGVLRLARYIDPFEDEGIILEDMGTAIEDSDAVDIIRHTLTKLPISMINGYNTYDGTLFSTFSIAD